MSSMTNLDSLSIIVNTFETLKNNRKLAGYPFNIAIILPSAVLTVCSSDISNKALPNIFQNLRFSDHILLENSHGTIYKHVSCLLCVYSSQSLSNFDFKL